MMKRVNLWCLLFSVVVLTACSAPPLTPAQFSYGEKAINLNLTPDAQLNLYQESAHTLLVCVYQLSDPNAFNQRTSTQQGLYELLQCGSFDPSITNAERIIVYPGMDVVRSLDRAEGTRYVAIAAGYYNLGKDSVTRMFSIPVKEETVGVLSRQRIASPDLLNIILKLGPQGIE